MIVAGAYARHHNESEWSVFSPRGRGESSGDLGPDVFPGRWNPRRSIPSEYAPLCSVVGHAIEAAGWWHPGSGAVVDGGLVVVRDGGPESAMLQFARAVHDPTASVLRPNGFLQALPSTLSSMLGLLYGFRDYHATLVGGAPAGISGLRHLLDLLALDRIERGVLAVLSDGCAMDRARASTDETADWATMIEEGQRLYDDIKDVFELTTNHRIGEDTDELTRQFITIMSKIGDGSCSAEDWTFWQ